MSAEIPKRTTRTQLFVDPEVQGALVARAIIYWIVCTLTIALLLLCWRVLTGPVRPLWFHLENLWYFHSPALIASLIVLPVAITDMIRVSNRFAGPMVRLRHGMRALAKGRKVPPIQFRQDDFWYEFAEEFNAVVRQVDQLRECERETREPEESPDDSLPVAAGSHA
ncbi:MAG: hypothetical protein GXX96_19350 [Planctomycetaceae bacterium]|mgnify:CR=1 FL=1|nr:hypothetical protein [Planctomycetaceae bacterium]